MYDIYIYTFAKCFHQATYSNSSANHHMTSSTGSQPRSNGVVPPIRLDHLFGMHFCKSPKSLNVPMTPYCFVKYIRFNSNLLPNLAIWHHNFLPISGIFQKLTSLKIHISFHSNPRISQTFHVLFPHSARETVAKNPQLRAEQLLRSPGRVCYASDARWGRYEPLQAIQMEVVMDSPPL